MESFTAAVQKAMASPTVKKLRALEQTRVARVTQKHAARRARASETLKSIDAAAKAAAVSAATRRAADLQAQADDLEAQARDVLDFANAFESDAETEDI